MARKTLIGAGTGNDNRKSGPGKAQKKRAARRSSPGPRNPIAFSVVETIAISELRPAAYNPRRQLKPGDPEFAKLERSIREFGLVDPPIWNRTTGNLVGGHQRLAVLKHIHPEITELAVSVVELPLAAEKALNIALNKVGGAWDDEKLTELLRDLQMEGDATATGFDQLEIDALLEELAGHGAGEGGDTSPQLGNMEYRVIVDCRNEEHQRAMLERFAKEKLPCRALIS